LIEISFNNFWAPQFIEISFKVAPQIQNNQNNHAGDPSCSSADRKSAQMFDGAATAGPRLDDQKRSDTHQNIPLIFMIVAGLL
jgi:hypothetical protein